MGYLVDQSRRTVTSSNSPLRFENTGSQTWPTWDRFLSVNGVKAYHLGNICGTCAFFFERLDAAAHAVDVGALSSALAEGLVALDADLVASLSQLMPAGEYSVLLLDFQPLSVAIGDESDYFAAEQVESVGVDPYYGQPHDPKVTYYRRGDRAFINVAGCGAALFDFVAPMSTTLDEARVAHYVHALDGGKRPTAVALSVLDTKQPEIEDGLQHWCMTHYLLDGHHKLAAAARTGRAVSLLAFVATDRGITLPGALDAVISAYASR